MIQNYYNYMFMPFLPPNCDKPPTIYAILESIVNPEVDLNDPAPDVKIKDLPREGRAKIFNFDYPLSTHINKEDFEILILKHYMMRRINFDTVTAFRINLDAKLNEIMPMYNKMFDALDNWNIFTDGEVTTRTGQDATTTTAQRQSTNNASNSLSNSSTTGDTSTSDRRYSDTPQNRLAEVRDGEYVTDYNYDTTTSSGTDSSTSSGTSQSTTNENDSGTDNKSYNETITRTPADKIAIMKEMQENIKSIYTLIFDELDVLFYGLY